MRAAEAKLPLPNAYVTAIALDTLNKVRAAVVRGKCPLPLTLSAARPQLSAVAFGHYRHVLSAVFEELVRSVYFDARRVLDAHAAPEDDGAVAAAREALKVGDMAACRSTPSCSSPTVPTLPRAGRILRSARSCGRRCAPAGRRRASGATRRSGWALRTDRELWACASREGAGRCGG